MNSLWKAEPTMILSVVSAGIALAIGFGAHITTQQMGLIMAFVAAVLGLINRSQVTSPATLDAMTPATLGAAQSTLQPVKDVVKKLPVILLACVLAGSAFGCVKAPPNLTPQSSGEYYATQAIRWLDTVRDAADAAHHTTPPLISAQTDLLVVNWHVDALATIHAIPTGWRLIVLTALDKLQAKLPAAEAGHLKAAIDAARTYLKESGS